MGPFPGFSIDFWGPKAQNMKDGLINSPTFRFISHIYRFKICLIATAQKPCPCISQWPCETCCSVYFIANLNNNVFYVIFICAMLHIILSQCLNDDSISCLNVIYFRFSLILLVTCNVSSYKWGKRLNMYFQICSVLFGLVELFQIWKYIFSVLPHL